MLLTQKKLEIIMFQKAVDINNNKHKHKHKHKHNKKTLH
jgi:hypothetical protein